jgi:hypothetical protein
MYVYMYVYWGGCTYSIYHTRIYSGVNVKCQVEKQWKNEWAPLLLFL